MITFEGLSFSYGNMNEEQLKSLNLQIERGEFVLLCGRSACGKTTATKCINGLIPHFSEGKYSGAVFVKGKDVANTPIYKISEDVGSVFQNPKTQFFNLDSNSELVFGMENLGVPPEKINVRMKEVTHDLGIENLLGRSVFDLSGGEKQILALASIYAVNPDIYVLDEPTAGVDPQERVNIRNYIHSIAKDRIVLISTHIISDIEMIANEIIIMNHGKFLCTLDDEENVEDAYLKWIGDKKI